MQPALPWQITLEDKVVRLDDLPGTLLGAVARKHGLSWVDLLLFPARDLDAFVDLVAAVAKHLDVEMPPHGTVGEVTALTACIDRTDDDRPTMYDADRLPLPVTDDQTTDSSLSSSENSDGLRTSSDDRPTET